MEKTSKKRRPSQNAIITALLLAVFTITYLHFTTYSPKALAEVREVRGVKNHTSVFSIPYPMNTQKISDNKTLSARQVTLQTTQTPNEIQEFYNNVLTSEGWKVEAEGSADIFYTTEYKNEGDCIKISTSKQKEDSNITIVSIEMERKEEE